MDVLIFGDPVDPHIAAVQTHLCCLGCDSIIFNRYDLNHLLTINLSHTDYPIQIETDAASISIEEVKAVWWRLKPIFVSAPTDSLEQTGERFASREWRFALQSLPLLFDQACWINSLEHQNRAALKPFQLSLAQKVGLRIPDTVITNNPNMALSLFSRHQRVIYKTLTNFVFPPDQFIFTTEISKEKLMTPGWSVERAPGIFQELIEKSYELRVTIIGNKVFAIRINSQSTSKTSLDWRRSQMENIYEPIEVDHNLEVKLLDFHLQANLHFATYDLIITPQGEPVFLECNPAGQWMWLEEATGIPVSKRLASDLAQA